MSAATAAPAPKTRQHAARLISPTQVRRYLLDRAGLIRHHKFTRVSAATIDLIEGQVRGICDQLVKAAPSKGVTL